MHVQRAAEMMIINCYSEQVPYLSLQYGPRSFAAAGPSTWNSLPALLRSCHLISLFRRDLKTELFIRAYHQHARDCF